MLGAGSSEAVLVLYRVSGGPVAVDQRLTVFEDGRVVLDERHRSRGPISQRLERDELDRLRAGLRQISDTRWSHPGKLRRARTRRWFSDLFAYWERDRGADYELWRGRRVISNVIAGGMWDMVSRDYDIPPDVVELLHQILVRAIRSEPR